MRYFVRRARVAPSRLEAEHRLLIATAAAMACRDDSGGFRDLPEVAATIRDLGAKRSLDRVVVAPDSFAATQALAVYLVEDESSPEKLHIIVPLSERAFVGVELRSDGDVAGFAGSSY